MPFAVTATCLLRKNVILCLYSNSLLNKSGFNDGDIPDAILDYFDIHDIPYDNLNWHVALHRIVKEYMLPLLTQKVEVTFIVTNHNPVRATSIDGKDVRKEWNEDIQTPLDPEFICVPISVIVKVCSESSRS